MLHPAASRAPARLPTITERCTGCGRCVAVCAPHVLWLEPCGWKKSALLHDPLACTGCSDCARVCPFNAIRMVRAAGSG